tara:strand:+ start:604 stop:2073 length:1470 start_codon:yes stop_codon:yes gene_type:complete
MTRARELADLLTGGQTITTADNTTQLTLTSTDADASVGPVLDLVRDSGSPADSDLLGSIKFIADDDGGNATTFASVSTQIGDASDGTESSALQIKAMSGGSLVSKADFLVSETVFNNGSADIDFRVESDGDANMFFVDAGNNRIGVGTNSPTVPFEIKEENAGFQAIFDNDNGSAKGLKVRIKANDSGDFPIFQAVSGSTGSDVEVFTINDDGRVTVTEPIQFGTDAQTNITGGGTSDADLILSGDTNIRFETGTNEQMRIDSSGNVGIGTTSPTQPLSISANGANGLFLVRDEGDAADSCRLFFDSSNTRYALFAKDGVLSIRSGGTPGSSSGTERVQFTVNGINSAAVAANGTVSAANLFISGGNNFQKSSSSSRYKTDITDSTRGLSDVMKMRSVTYKGINDGDRFFGGLIAEEVHDAGLIEYVDYRQDDDGNDIPEGVHYGHMVALAFKAIQELKTELDAEKAKTAALQTQVADLITRVTALEAE